MLCGLYALLNIQAGIYLVRLGSSQLSICHPLNCPLQELAQLAWYKTKPHYIQPWKNVDLLMYMIGQNTQGCSASAAVMAGWCITFQLHSSDCVCIILAAAYQSANSCKISGNETLYQYLVSSPARWLNRFIRK